MNPSDQNMSRPQDSSSRLTPENCPGARALVPRDCYFIPVIN